MKKMKKAHAGFTLTEVMIATVISTFVIFGAFTLLQVSNKHLDVSHARMSLEEASREALFKMAQEIRQSSADRIQDFGGANKTSGSEINFHVPIPDPDAATLVGPDFTPAWAANIRYWLDSGTRQLMRTSTEFGSSEQLQAVIANDVTALSFSRSDATSALVTIQVSVQHALPDGTQVPSQPLVLSTTAEARNP